MQAKKPIKKPSVSDMQSVLFSRKTYPQITGTDASARYAVAMGLLFDA